MTATVHKFPKINPRLPEVDEWQERTNAAILELGEQMDNMRKLLDQPHATDEYDRPLNKRGLANVLWILACWNMANTVALAIWLVR